MPKYTLILEGEYDELTGCVHHNPLMRTEYSDWNKSLDDAGLKRVDVPESNYKMSVKKTKQGLEVQMEHSGRKHKHYDNIICNLVADSIKIKDVPKGNDRARCKVILKIPKDL